jgi:hypothetical protein
MASTFISAGIHSDGFSVAAFFSTFRVDCGVRLGIRFTSRRSPYPQGQLNTAHFGGDPIMRQAAWAIQTFDPAQPSGLAHAAAVTEPDGVVACEPSMALDRVGVLLFISIKEIAQSEA